MTTITLVDRVTPAFIAELNANFGALDAIADFAVLEDINGDADITRDLLVVRNLRTSGVFGLGTSVAPNAKFHLQGAGPAVAVVDTSASLLATIAVQDTGVAVNNGGQIIFGAGQGFFAAVKGLISTGSNNTTGRLSFQVRAVDTDGTLTERLQLSPTGVTLIGTLGQSSGSTFFMGNSGGTGDALTFTPTPALTAYTTGAFYIGKATAANTVTAPTVSISGLGAKTIVKRAATALAANDYVNGKPLLLWYDGTNMILLNPAAL